MLLLSCKILVLTRYFINSLLHIKSRIRGARVTWKLIDEDYVDVTMWLGYCTTVFFYYYYFGKMKPLVEARQRVQWYYLSQNKEFNIKTCDNDVRTEQIQKMK